MGDAAALGTAGHVRLPGPALRLLSDERLAAMVTAGSDEAFATLYDRHHQAIYRYCRAQLSHEADARDALQNSMLAALSALRASAIEGRFKPWLFRIAHNESISIIRRRTREAPTAAPPETPSSDDPETREEVRTLVADLTALPERQRGAIVMRELSGLSYAEIATVLATTEAGGKQLVYEARTAMHELREGHEMSCESVRERISAGDRRLLRGRKVRSHLRGCQPCQDFERGIDRRRTAFAALAPPLPALAAAAVLGDVFGSGGAGGGLGGGGAAAGAGATTAASGGTPLAGLATMKVAGAALLAGAVGVGAYEAGSAIFSDPPISTSAAATTENRMPVTHPGDGSARDAAHPAQSKSPDRARAGAGKANPKSGPDSTAAKPGAANDGDAPTSGAPTSSSTGGSTGGTGGSTGGTGGTGGDPPPPPPGGGDPPPPPPGGPAPGTPAGHGGTPPGQGGTPPGQIGGGTPPGHLGNPGNGHP